VTTDAPSTPHFDNRITQLRRIDSLLPAAEIMRQTVAEFGEAVRALADTSLLSDT
jgi:hypothetical protein